jgi:kynurenine formamidase
MPDGSTLIEALRGARIIDLSQTLEEHMPHFPTHSKFFHNLWGSYWHGNRSLSYQITMHEHNGTHVDAPAHFISDAKPHAHVTIENVPLRRLIGRGVRIDCRGMKEGDYVSKDFVTGWEAKHGALATKPIHPVVFEKQVLIIENLTNLDQLPDFFLFLALPLKIRGGSGSPVRAVGIV